MVQTLEAITVGCGAGKEVSGVEGGFRPFPGAMHPRQLPRVKAGRVVGIGAICDLARQLVPDARSQSFSVSEFVTLEDGRRVILHDDRGFTIGLGRAGEPYEDLRAHQTRDSIIRNVLLVVLPDEKDAEAAGEDHPWSWLAELARARGLNVTAEDLRGLPYEVVLTDELTRWLEQPGS
jgi:CBS domain-containing protein